MSISEIPETRNELSGTVIGPSVQAGAIHGSVHLHEAAHEPPPTPRQLLAPPPNFVSRDGTLATLDELLDRAAPLVVLSGPGGVGKTALAMRWTHTVRDHFPDGQLHIDLGGFSGEEPVDPGEALARFLRALGVPAARIPLTLAEQATLYRSVTAGRSLLLVLDNAYSAAQVRVLLPAPGASMTIVTSRNRLAGLIPAGAALVDVAPLPAADSLRLLAQAVGPDRIDRERTQAENLAGICGGMPIALCVVAARLAARPRLSVGRVAAELADEASRLDALTMHDGPSVEAAFDVSYRSLDEPAAALYRGLGLHPGPEFGMGPVVAVASAHRAAKLAPAAVVDVLLEANLLYETTEERFRFHDLLRLHAARRAETDETPRDREDALRAMIEWYLAAAGRADTIVTPYRRRLPYHPVTAPGNLPVLAGRDAALGWLEQERVNVMSAGRAALDHGYHELAWQLSDVMWPLFLYHKHYRDRMEADRRGVVAAQAWGNTWAEADMLKRLCGAHARTGDYDEAEKQIRRAILLCRTSGDMRGDLDAQEALAMLYRDSGRRTEAVALFTHVLAANRELGDDRCTGLSLINLAMLLSTQGRPNEAIELLEEARRLFATLSRIDPYNEVRVLIGLAYAYLGSNDQRRAEDAADEAALRMRDLGSEHGQAEALHVLGQVAERRGNLDAAARHYRIALDIFTALGSAQASPVRRRLAVLSDLDPTAVQETGEGS